MLWYAGIEAYPERYTGQLDAWMKKAFRKYNVEYTSCEPVPCEDASVKTGQVLDARNRVAWATTQVQMLVDAMASGAMKAGDKILLMDFWHPGIDGLFYALHQFGLHRVQVYAYCWAQSMDEYDFTHDMRRWMRPMEQGIANRLSRVFVADDGLAELFNAATNTNKAVTVGLPFDSDAVRQIATDGPGEYDWSNVHKRNCVVYSSRFDSEKDPGFFIQVATEWRKRFGDSTEFIMTTSSKKIRSNADYLVEQIKDAEDEGVIRLFTEMSKEGYYRLLLDSKVQFNCALQDWVSFTLLEAVTFGCFPVYPMRRSFPQALQHVPEFLYRPGDVDDAIDRIGMGLLGGIQKNWSTPEAIKARQDLILTPHDNAIKRMLSRIGEGEVFHIGQTEENEALANWKKWRETP